MTSPKSTSITTTTITMGRRYDPSEEPEAFAEVVVEELDVLPNVTTSVSVVVVVETERVLELDELFELELLEVVVVDELEEEVVEVEVVVLDDELLLVVTVGE